MDIRVLSVVLCMAVIAWWLYRRRLQADAELHSDTVIRQRRTSDRTFTGRQLNRLYGEQDQTLSVESANDATLRGAASDTVADVSSALSAVKRVYGEKPALRGSLERVHKPLREAALSTDARVAEINRLKELLRQRDHRLMRDRHAMEEVDKLKRRLHDRGRELEMLKQACARSDAALAHYRDKGQQAAMLEQQLVQLRRQCQAQAEELRIWKQSLPAESISGNTDAGSVSTDTGTQAPAVRIGGEPLHEDADA